MAEFFNAPPTTQSLGEISRVPLDPTLDSCCQREIEQESARTVALNAVRSKDKIFERQRMMELENRKLRCGCCFVERVEGEDYPVLAGLRSIKFASMVAGEAAAFEDAPVDGHGRVGEEEDSEEEDSDSEFLDDLPSSFTSSIAENALKNELLRAHGFGFPLSLAVTSLPTALDPLVAGEHVPTVLHLYDPTLADCAHLDLYLEGVASDYVGTRWFRADGTKLFDNPYPEMARLRASLKLESRGDLPALVAVRGGVLVNVSKGLQALGKLNRAANLSPNFPSEPCLTLSAVQPWLDSCGVLSSAQAVDVARLCKASTEIREMSERAREDEEDGEVEERFDCGMSGCCKTFVHQHIGAGEVEGQGGQLLREGVDSLTM
jgi:hypothetical protein